MIIINDIILTPDDDEQKVFEIAKRRLRSEVPDSLSIRKKAVDTRRSVRLVYSVSAHLGEKAEKRLVSRDKKLVYRGDTQRKEIAVCPERENPPIVVGFGPGGMFCALTLARAGLKPIVIERGSPIERRKLLVEKFWAGGALSHTNVQFGEGGAGTFSDGKLTTGINSPLCDDVLSDFVKFGADESILTAAKPHIGTDVLCDIVRNVRCEIERLGGKVLFDNALTGLDIKNGKIAGVKTTLGDMPCDTLVLALGHSARDTQEMLLANGFEMEKKAFSVGVRLEQKQETVNRAMYGEYAGHPALPPAEYKLSYREGQRGVYSFCMCPGGYVVASASEEGGVVTNGMSLHGRDGDNANAAIAVSVLPTDLESDVLSGVRFQRELERKAFELGGANYFAPCQKTADFIEGRKGNLTSDIVPTYRPGVREADLNEALPKFVCDMLKTGFAVFDKNRSGFNSMGGILTGVETRTSSPVRILRNEELQAPSCKGVYPCGEGAGYAGGIMSAACDGMKIALKIIKGD
ncbi:MAG: FAD-dependent oxidoreductase [Clostridia bacterium]|nr:FAD-dependent oxidoreductase [Clostridia bacterium]